MFGNVWVVNSYYRVVVIVIEVLDGIRSMLNYYENEFIMRVFF